MENERRLRCSACETVNEVSVLSSSFSCSHCGKFNRSEDTLSPFEVGSIEQKAEAVLSVLKKKLADEFYENAAPCTALHPKLRASLNFPCELDFGLQEEIEARIRRFLSEDGRYAEIEVTVSPSSASVGLRLNDAGAEESHRLYNKKNHVVADACADLSFVMLDVIPDIASSLF